MTIYSATYDLHNKLRLRSSTVLIQTPTRESEPPVHLGAETGSIVAPMWTPDVKTC